MKIKSLINLSAAFVICAGLFTGCYSVYEGGTSGVVVDSESTENPKQGIGNVQVYAYTKEDLRNTDFNDWKEGTVFTPGAEYYGHTATTADGGFTLSKLVWKSFNPTFGKDADVEKVFLLFYHREYGLVKGETIIVSDSTAQTVYQEMTKIRKTIPLAIIVNDVSTNSPIGSAVSVEITVPQNNGKIKEAEPLVYKSSISGNGVVSISYPRFVYDEEGNETPNTPVVSIKYFQADENITWKACYNADNSEQNYAFRDLEKDAVTKTIPDYNSYAITLYGKSCKMNYPVFNGTYHSTKAEFGLSADDGKEVLVKLSDGTVIGSDTTQWNTVGTTSTIMHGNFTVIGNGQIEDLTYTTKNVTRSVKFFVNGNEAASTLLEISFDKSSYNVSLSD